MMVFVSFRRTYFLTVDTLIDSRWTNRLNLFDPFRRSDREASECCCWWFWTLSSPAVHRRRPLRQLKALVRQVVYVRRLYSSRRRHWRQNLNEIEREINTTDRILLNGIDVLVSIDKVWSTFFFGAIYRSCFSVRECNELVDVDMVSVKLKLKLILKPFVCRVLSYVIRSARRLRAVMTVLLEVNQFVITML